MRVSKNLEEVQYFKDCYEALRQETLRYRNRTPRNTYNFTQEEFFLLTDAIVAQTFPSKESILLRDYSWVFKQCCLLNDARKLRLLATPGDKSATQIYDMDVRIVMSATVHNLSEADKRKHVFSGNEVSQDKTTSHGQTQVGAFGSEEADVPPLGEVDFTPKKFFSFSDRNKEGDDDVEYESDSQKGDLNGSPHSLQLNFDSPFSVHKDLRACVALLKNSFDCLGAE